MPPDPTCSTNQLLARLRRFYWRRVRRYAYEICQRCGRPVGGRAFGLTRDSGLGSGSAPWTYWFADNDLWNEVMGGEAGVLCPACFTETAERKGIAVGWRCGRVGVVER